MSFFKNLLLVVIAIQLFVMLQLVAVKKWNLQSDFQKAYQLFTLENLFQNHKISKQEHLFYSYIKIEVEKHLKNYTRNTIQNKFFILNSCYANATLRKKIELYAKEFLGTRYVWGATGPNKFDCSGFTQKVYREAGFKLPRVSREQAKVGTYVSYENLQCGDMVFFDTNHKKVGRVNHVGIYLGDKKFIHASSGNKKVVITSFNKRQYYKNRFLWGRRIIKDQDI